MKKNIPIIIGAIVFLLSAWFYYQSSSATAKLNWTAWQNNLDLAPVKNELLFFKAENLDLAEKLKNLEASISALKKAVILPAPALTSNTPPGSGFFRYFP